LKVTKIYIDDGAGDNALDENEKFNKIEKLS